MAASGAVVFDAGETLFSEERSWKEWAEWLGVPSARLLSALDESIRQRMHHKTAFESVRPDLTFEEQRERRRAEGFVERFTADDLYPDALPTIRRLKDTGYVVGVVGNHPRGMPDVLGEWNRDSISSTPRRLGGRRNPIRTSSGRSFTGPHSRRRASSTSATDWITTYFRRWQLE